MRRYRVATSNSGACPVSENTVQGGDPESRGTEAKRACTRRIRSDHAADGAKRSAGWVNRKSKALLTRSAVDFSANRARCNRNSPSRFVDDTYFVETAKIDYHPGPHCTASHPTTRAPRDKRRPRAIRPDGKSANVVSVARNRYCRGDLPGNAGSFGVDRSRSKIFAEYAAEFARRQVEEPFEPLASGFRGPLADVFRFS